MYKSNPTSNKNVELFTEDFKKDLINLKTVRKFQHNITREEQAALKKIKTGTNRQLKFKIKGQDL